MNLLTETTSFWNRSSELSRPLSTRIWVTKYEVFKMSEFINTVRVHTVLKSPWILGEVLEESLNSIFPWKVLKFLCKSLKIPWIFFNFKCGRLESVFLCFLLVQDWKWIIAQRILKVIYTKCSMFYSIINYQFKTSELKNVEKLVKQRVQALKLY